MQDQKKLNLHITPTNPHTERLVRENEKTINEWLNSTKFKKLLEENPIWWDFPPLLDPDAVQYEKTDPNIAWDLNIPLPPRYSAMYLGEHGTAHGFFMRCLQEAGVGLNQSHFRDNGKKRYMDFYLNLVYGKEPHKIINCNEWGFVDCEKFAALCAKKVPAFTLVRDPVGQLAHSVRISNANLWPNICINLQTDPKSIPNNRAYTSYDEKTNSHLISKEPSLEAIKGAINNACGIAPSAIYANLPKKLTNTIGTDYKNVIRASFVQHDTFRAFKNITNIEYLEFSELSAKNAFTTMQKFCEKFGFSLPSRREFYEGSMSEWQGLLPLKLFASLDKNAKEVFELSYFKFNEIFTNSNAVNNVGGGNLGNSPKNITDKSHTASKQEKEWVAKNRGVCVILDTLQWYDNDNISRDFLIDLKEVLDLKDNEFLAENNNITIKSTQAELEYLEQNKDLCAALRKYLIELFCEFEKAQKKSKEQKISEEDVLKYLQENPLWAKKFIAICQERMEHIRQNRADLLKRFKSFQKLLKMKF